MLLSVKETIGMRLKALDGSLGSLKDIYFDDGTWAVRWLVASLGSSRTSAQVLIDPRKLWVDASGTSFEIGISVAAGRQLPSSSLALPVCRQYASPLLTGRSNLSRDPHLRSCLTLLQGYSLTEEGEKLGTLTDFRLDTREWQIPFISFRMEGSEESPAAVHPTEIVRQISCAGSKILVQRFMGELSPPSHAAVAA